VNTSGYRGETISNDQATRLLHAADVATGTPKLEKSCITLTSFISFATNLLAAECGQDSGWGMFEGVEDPNQRVVLIPPSAAVGLVQHAFEEIANLASKLLALYQQRAPKPTSKVQPWYRFSLQPCLNLWLQIQHRIANKSKPV